MDDSKRELVSAWLRKARSDLGSARKLLAGAEVFPDTAIYHCQQAAEKALKAYLVAVDKPPAKTHNLVLLVQECTDVHPGFERWMDAAEALTPYATIYRYPDEMEPPDLDEAAAALPVADGIVGFVAEMLSMETGKG